jgi:hypothetical protein
MVVLDLKPEGYKLLRFKAAVLRLLDAGTLEHTITAFWEYLLLLEVCHKLLEKDKVVHTRDPRLTASYRRLARLYEGDEYVAEGDFSERMSKLIGRISDDYRSRHGSDSSTVLSTGEITELLYKHYVPLLRAEVTLYLKAKDGLLLLFDNLDKGWPTHGLQPEDLVIIRALLDATRKVERQLERVGVTCQTLVVLRNDVYALLVEETPDRGKEARASLDWTDPELLREVLRLRLVFSGLPGNAEFLDLWRSLCISHIRGEESSQYLIDRCLMRPRSLIDLVTQCKGAAVNLRHSKIDVEDIAKGLRAYSTDLVFEIGLEIRDVFPEAEEVLYLFIQEPPRFSAEALARLLAKSSMPAEKQEAVKDLLLWYGFVGIVADGSGEAVYIHSVNYDMQLLRGLMRKAGQNVLFEINSAFRPALEVAET